MCINFSSDVIIMYFFASHLNPILQMRSVFNTFKVTKPLLNLILYSDHHAVGRAPRRLYDTTQMMPFIWLVHGTIGKFVDKLFRVKYDSN